VINSLPNLSEIEQSAAEL